MTTDSHSVLSRGGLAEGIVPDPHIVIPRALGEFESEDIQRAFVHRRHPDGDTWVGKRRILAVPDNGLYRLPEQIARTSRLDLRNGGDHPLERRPVQPDHIFSFRVPVRQRDAVDPVRILDLLIIGQVMMNLHQNDVKRRKRHRHSKNVQHPRKRRAKFPFSEYSHIRKTNYFRSTIPNYILPHSNVLTSTLRFLLVLPYSFRIDSPRLTSFLLFLS
ncbi:unknown [Alistipes sp. CAG:514]|nr:unknown [Alistipes sp. CAG:514]